MIINWVKREWSQEIAMTRNIKEMDIVFSAKSEMQKNQALQDQGYFEAACIRACVHGYSCRKCQNVNKI